METKKSPEQERNSASVPKSSNAILFWILGGCLALLLVAVVVIAGLAWWGYKKVKTGEQKNQAMLVEWQKQAAQISQPEASPPMPGASQNFQEDPQAAVSNDNGAQNNSSIEFPENTERQMGYIKKVYSKNGKNYLDIDYIQWLTGAAAEQAMREDGQCPKTGECIVYDDYYIRNQNPLIRTFEISSDAKFVMETYNSEQTGVVGNDQEISSDKFKEIFSSGIENHLKDVPYIVEICNQQISKITEQYIP